MNLLFTSHGSLAIEQCEPKQTKLEHAKKASLMRYRPKNCMRDHTLMQHSNIYKHTNKSNNRTAQNKHITKHRTATLAVLSVVTCF